MSWIEAQDETQETQPRDDFGNVIADYYKQQQSKKPLEFMQLSLLLALFFSFGVVLLTLLGDFLLLWNGHQPMSDEAVAVVTTYGGITASVATAAYSALTAIRNWSFNKHVTNAHIITGADNMITEGDVK